METTHLRGKTGKFLTSEEPRVGFSRRGVKLSDFKPDGTQPEGTDVLMMEVMKGRRSGAMVWKIG